VATGRRATVWALGDPPREGPAVEQHPMATQRKGRTPQGEAGWEPHGTVLEAKNNQKKYEAFIELGMDMNNEVRAPGSAPI